MSNQQEQWRIQVASLLYHNVPRFINHIAQRGGVRKEELIWLSNEEDDLSPAAVINCADKYLLFPKDEETFQKGLFVLVKALAIMSFVPGGVKFLGMRFCSEIEGFVEDES